MRRSGGNRRCRRSTPLRTPPIVRRSWSRSLAKVFLVAVLLVFLGELGARNHRDVLSAQVVRRSGRNPLHGYLCARKCHLWVVLEVAALGRGQRSAGLVALAVINDPEL